MGLIVNFTEIIFTSEDWVRIFKLSYVSKTTTVKVTMSPILKEGAYRQGPLSQATEKQECNGKNHPINVKVTYQLSLQNLLSTTQRSSKATRGIKCASLFLKEIRRMKRARQKEYKARHLVIFLLPIFKDQMLFPKLWRTYCNRYISWSMFQLYQVSGGR